MSYEYNASAAKAMYEAICIALDNRDWKYTRHDEKLFVTFGVNGEDLPMNFLFRVTEDAPYLQLISRMPFTFPGEKLVEGAIAVAEANWGCINGCFDLDLEDGEVLFKLTQSFRDSLIGDNCIQYMIDIGCNMVDQYSARFLALSKGIMSIEEFLAKENK